jgi:hypothetical protein
MGRTRKELKHPYIFLFVKILPPEAAPQRAPARRNKKGHPQAAL